MTGARPGPLVRVATWPLEVLVLAYRTLISPLLPQSCRYYPSCSSYALEALRRFGPVVGTWLAVRRLSRCHPWTAGGVDHVPPRGSHGLPDWAAYRVDAARREARWAAGPEAEVAPGREAGDASDVRNDERDPVRRGMH